MSQLQTSSFNLNTAVHICLTCAFTTISAFAQDSPPSTKDVLGDIECDCTIVPFEPIPPCFELCFIDYASTASKGALVTILGLDEELATKISNLNNLGMQVAGLAASGMEISSVEIQVTTNEGLETFVAAGVYEDSGTLKVIAEKNRFFGEEYSAVSIPAALTSFSDDGSLIAWAEATTVETPQNWTFDGPASFRPINYWTETLLSPDEIQELRSKMKLAGDDDLQLLVLE